MNEYLFYYHDTLEVNGYTAPLIWYFKTKADSIMEAIRQFTEFAGDEDKLIQIIIKGNLQ
jgi:hypothetical protein